MCHRFGTLPDLKCSLEITSTDAPHLAESQSFSAENETEVPFLSCGAEARMHKPNKSSGNYKRNKQIQSLESLQPQCTSHCHFLAIGV